MTYRPMTDPARFCTRCQGSGVEAITPVGDGPTHTLCPACGGTGRARPAR